MKLESLFAYLITLQFAIVVLHDWVDVPGWTHGRQVQAVVGRNKLLIATLLNALFPALAVVFAFWFWDRSQPTFVVNYWAIYCAITVLSAIVMWYVPYFVGTGEKKRVEYLRMYAGTRHILPLRGDNPRPNLLHLLFHLLFLATFAIAVILRLRAT